MSRKARGIIGLHAFLLTGTLRVLADYQDNQQHSANPDGNDTTRVVLPRRTKEDAPPIVLTGMKLDI